MQTIYSDKNQIRGCLSTRLKGSAKGGRDYKGK